MSALHGSLRAKPWLRRALWIGGLIAGLALIPLSLSGEASADRVQKLSDELAETEARAQELRVGNAERDRRIEALRNDERAIEEIARDELGMVFPGEILYHIEPARSAE